MDVDSEWEFFGVAPDGEPFLIGGVDVWKHVWRRTRERARVKDPRYHQDFTFDVYEIGDPGAVVTFAAGEFSACMWGFYVRRRDGSSVAAAGEELEVLDRKKGMPSGKAPMLITIIIAAILLFGFLMVMRGAYRGLWNILS